MNPAIPIGLISLPLISSPLTYLTGRLLGRRSAPARWLARLVLVAAWVIFAMMVRDYADPTIFRIEGVAFRVDGLSLLFAALSLFLGTLAVIYSGPIMAGRTGEEKYYALLLALTGTMIALGCAADLFNLWVWFEAMVVATYLLVVFYREKVTSLEAAVKYLVQSAIGSVLVILGIALVLAQTGTLDLAAISAAGKPDVLVVAGVLFVLGFGVKIAIVPLHTWLPDVYSESPSGISAVMSGVVTKAGLVALLRVLAALAGVAFSWGALLMMFGVLNIFVGNLLALRQQSIKRLLAYSSMSQIGYMLLGIGIGIYTGESSGIQGGLFHVLNHGLMKGLAFFVVGALLYALGRTSGNEHRLTIADLSGAARRYPLLGLAFTLALLSLGGVPPLAGFMSKWQIFVAGLGTGTAWIDWLVIFAALNSVLSLGYYLPVINTLFRDNPAAEWQRGRAIPLAMIGPILVLAVLMLLIGLWPGALTWLTQPAAASLLAAFGG
ncbi:MAG TPA: proton-conducting transporter membrane subunit [Phototrophicaceae bacterium]|nr:proton-conducting transporter membrane subunit [Phototrophicaceae bacterium]